MVDSLDSFIRTLRVFAEGASEVKGRGKGKGREKEREGGKQVSIVVTKAERLPKVMGSGWSVMTRLAELVSYRPAMTMLSRAYDPDRLINRLVSQ